MPGIGCLFIFSISPDVELTSLTKVPQIGKMFRKEEYPLKGCLNMEVIPEDSQKRSDYLLLIQARLYGWSVINLIAIKSPAINLTGPRSLPWLTAGYAAFPLSPLIVEPRGFLWDWNRTDNKPRDRGPKRLLDGFWVLFRKLPILGGNLLIGPLVRRK